MRLSGLVSGISGVQYLTATLHGCHHHQLHSAIFLSYSDIENYVPADEMKV